MENISFKPNFFSQSAAWRAELGSLAKLGRQCPFHNPRKISDRPPAPQNAV